MRLRLDSGQLVTAVIVLLAALLVLWIAQNTYWEEVESPVRVRGEAAVNPFYGAQRLAARLGVYTVWRQDTLQLPPANQVIFAGPWSFEVPERTQQVERWVARGGRLVLDGRALAADEELHRWAGIERVPVPPDPNTVVPSHSHGIPVTAASAGDDPWGAPRHYELCCMNRYMQLKTREVPTWTLRDGRGHLLGVRAAIGSGSVTLISGEPFGTASLLGRGELAESQALLLVEALQLRGGDILYFLSDAEGPTLLPLMWRTGWPAILLVLGLIVLALWRAAPRFGPLEAPVSRARRSLGEQIRGTGQFTLRHGGGQALLAAAAQALAEAAGSRIRGYAALSPAAQAAALEPLTGMARGGLATALGMERPRNRRELYRSLLALESARRALLMPAHKVKVTTHADRLPR